MPQVKLFTPKEANQTLPLVKRVVDDILKAGQEIRSLSVNMEKPEEDPAIDRLMGLILTAIAVEMLLKGIEGFVRSL